MSGRLSDSSRSWLALALSAPLESSRRDSLFADNSALCASFPDAFPSHESLLKREFFLHCSRLAFWHDQRVLRSLDSFHFSNAEWAWPGLHARTRR